MRVGRLLVFMLVAGALVAGTTTAVAPATVDVSGVEAAAISCAAGSKRAIVGGKVKCLRTGQACAARYQAVYKKYGFTCSNGRLRKRAKVTPPPPPPAQPGHYKGMTSQLEVFEFDVSATGTVVQNFHTGQINEGCTPPAHLSGGNLTGGSAPITRDGSFKIDYDYTSAVGGNPSKGHFTVTGHFSGTTATGTLQDSTTFSLDGRQYSCGSGLQNWTATRAG